MPFLCQHYELMCNDRMDDKQYNKYRFINWAIGGEGEEGHNNMEETITAKAWTADEIEDIWHRYQNGETPSALAEAYGKSVGSIKGVIRRRKEKENKEAQTGKEIETSVDAELGDIEEVEEALGVEVEEESEEESEEPDEDYRGAMRTHVKPSFIRPRKKEMGRLYTGMAYKMRKKK